MNSLVDLLKTQTDQRLLRLFAVGCCRMIWHLIKNQRSRTAVEVAEMFADGKFTQKKLKKVYAAAWEEANIAAWEEANADVCAAANAVAYTTAYAAAYWAASAAAHAVANAAAHAATTEASYDAAYAATTEKQLKLYYCLFTKTVFTTTNRNALTLARLIYLDRNWPLMPILGDALEEAGTINEVVNHCKEKEHARGCWVIDNLLGHRK